MTAPNAESPEGDDAIRVCVRIRPFTTYDGKENQIAVVVPPEANGSPPRSICVIPVGADRAFRVDRVFDTTTGQQEVYDAAAKPIVESVLRGFNGTVLAYGQTSSGKTFTMEGPPLIGLPLYPWGDEAEEEDSNDNELGEGGQQLGSPATMGIIPRMIRTVFNHIGTADEHIEFHLKVSMMEIYMEKIRDLLDTSRSNLRIREDPKRGIFVENLTEWAISDPEDVLDCLRTGQANRSVAETQMNTNSSRSHLIFCLTVHQQNSYDLSAKTGKLYLVDLAGSEKVSKTGAEGLTLDEAKMINKSLSCLGNVINALTSGAGPAKPQHTPYRDSKLTRVLQESLGGNSRTCLICTVSPAVINEAETLSTLRFGQRAKLIRNRAIVNEARSVEELERLLQKAEEALRDSTSYIAVLEAALRKANVAVPPRPSPSSAAAHAANKALPQSPQPTKLASKSSVKSPPQEGEGPWNLDATEVEDDVVRELREAIFDRNSRLKEQSERITELNSIVADMHEKVAELQKLEAVHADRISQQEEQIDQLTLERQQLEEEVLLLRTHQREQLNSTIVTPAPSSVSKENDAETREAGVQPGVDGEDEAKALRLEVERLKKSLTEEKRKNATLRDLYGGDEEGVRPLQRKMKQLDSHLEQLSLMYQKLVNQNSGLRVECQVNEKRVQRKDQRIAQLEKSVQESRRKYEKLLARCASLTSAVEQVHSLQQLQQRQLYPRFGPALRSSWMDAAGMIAAEGAEAPTPDGRKSPTTMEQRLWSLYCKFQHAGAPRRLNIVKPLKGGGSRSTNPSSPSRPGGNG